MKKELILYIVIILVITIISGSVTAYATSYLYNADEVSFNNNVATEISSDNLQGAVDQLYNLATRYQSVDERIGKLEGITLANGTNLNNITTPGIYYGYNNASAATMSNVPIAKGFTLLVLPSVKTQVFITFDGSVFKRKKESSWSSWVEFSPDSAFKNISSIQSNSTSTTTYYNNYATATTSGTITSVSNYHIIPAWCNYGFPTSASISGTTLTIKAINSSGGRHTMGCRGIVIATK